MIEGTKEYIGIATMDWTADANELLSVIIPELSPMLTGDLKKGADDSTPVDVKVINGAVGSNSETTVNTTPTIKVGYLGRESNMTPPDIYMGEKVKILNLGGANALYWYPFSRTDNLRTVEHVRMRICNKPEQDDPYGEETSYYIELDSRPNSRGIRIRTSKGTKEKVSYRIDINTDDSTITIEDDQEPVNPKGKVTLEKGAATYVPKKTNGFKLTSLESQWEMWNNEGSSIDMNKKELTFTIPDKIHMKTKKFILDADTSIIMNTDVSELNADTSETINTDKYELNAIASATINTATYTLTATTSALTTSAAIGLTGPVTITGTAAISGATTMSDGAAITGDSSIAGKVSATDDVKSDGDITAVNITASNNIKGTVGVLGPGPGTWHAP